MQAVSAKILVSQNNIISDIDQSILIQIRDNLRDNYFLIGDMANKYIGLVSNSRNSITAQNVFDAVGKYVGKSGRTVRYYAEEAMFYPSSIRAYYDILPFSYFVFARTMGDLWQDVLDYAMENPSCSLGGVKRHFLSADNIIEQAKEIIASDVVEQADNNQIRYAQPIYLLMDLTGKVNEYVETSCFSDNIKTRLGSVLMELKSILMEIGSE